MAFREAHRWLSGTRAGGWPRPEVVRAVAALAILVAWVLLPDDRDFVLAAAGWVLVGVTAVEVVAALLLEPVGRPAGVLRALAPATAGVLVLTGSRDDLLRLVGAAAAHLIVRGLGDVAAGVTVGPRLAARGWLAGLGIAELATGLLALLANELFGQTALAAVGLAWLVEVVFVELVPQRADAASLTIAPVPSRGPMADAERRRIADEVYYDGRDVHERVFGFTVLITFSTVIATYGLLGDSVAAVIGGMIIAPLMRPIQGLTAGLVAGAPRRAAVAALVLAGGIVLVVALSMLMASTSRNLVSDLGNDQIVGRTRPRLPDLAIALAAGAAGAFALVRRDVAGSIPGVAIAVSLVPPLCVTGATLAGGDGQSALGAFLLFLINLLGIVAAGGAVLALSGFGAVDERGGQRLLTLSAACGIALAVLAFPLATTGRDIVRRDSLESAVRANVGEWLEPVEPAVVLDVLVEGEHAILLVVSTGVPPPTVRLERAVTDTLGRHATIEVRWLHAIELGNS